MGLIEQNLREKGVLKVCNQPTGMIMRVDSADGRDDYNPSVPFSCLGDRLMFLREEERDRETGTKAVLYARDKEGTWGKIGGVPSFPLQDPFVEKIGGTYLLGGVAVDWKEGVYKTVFWVGKDVLNLKEFFIGPLGMKCIRMVEMPGDLIGVCTRPQGGVYGKGKIGFKMVNSQKELEKTNLANVRMLPDQFGEEKWGGANQLHYLENGKIGVIGHKAWFDNVGTRVYVAVAFEFDPQTLVSTPMKIVAERSDFPPTEAKREDLKNVIYPSGIYYDKGEWKLVAGLSDAYIGEIVIKYPFSSRPWKKSREELKHVAVRK